MKRIWVLFLCVPLVAAGLVPGRYIVELSTESVAQHLLRTGPRGQARSQFHGPEAERHRALIRGQQSAVRARIEAAQGTVTGSVENVADALMVGIPDTQAATLGSIPGVARVYPVRSFHLLLDHALPLHHIPEAWTQVGIGNAGAGIKVAIIDTGIDIGHPGFNDAGFNMPKGYPIANTDADLIYTTRKVIVARSYYQLFARPETDASPADHVGHGTATAMAAAGVPNSGLLANITGVAPQAYLGNYKVFGTPGVNDSTTESAIIQAVDDAVSDGMDVISMSLGSDVAVRLSDDLETQVLAQVSSLGIIVVVAAGNNGPDPGTISSPATSPAVIAVGASNNDRTFAGTVILPEGKGLAAVPAALSFTPEPITAPLVDVSALDPTGQACTSLPNGSLRGAIAFILRGNCTFELKLDNAAAAGALGALLYDNVPAEDPIIMSIGNAFLPGEMISNEDGLALKQQLTPGLIATLRFTLGPNYTDPARLSRFSAHGPNVNYSIKPDLVAVGQNMYTAAQRLDPKGAVFNITGYSIEQGTSFSTPLVAGAAAILKQARPGLTGDQYRSLLINSATAASLAPGTPAGVQQAGAGKLDLLAALNATVAAAPVSLSFGAGGSTLDAAATLTLSNVGTVTDTFQLAVVRSDNNSPVPELGLAAYELAPGASIAVPVTFKAEKLNPGQYEGFVTVQGTHSNVVSRVPYWYAVPSGTPAHVTILHNQGAGGAMKAGSGVTQAVIFRVTDESGLPVDGVVPTLTSSTNGATVSGLSSMDYLVPNSFTFNVRLSSKPGTNVFVIQAGTASATVSIIGQ